MYGTFYLKPMRQADGAVEVGDGAVGAVEDANLYPRVAKDPGIFFRNRCRNVVFGTAKRENGRINVLDAVEKPFGVQSASPIEFQTSLDIDLDDIAKMN